MPSDPLIAGDELVLFRTGENAGSAEQPSLSCPAFGLVVNAYGGGNVYDMLSAPERRPVDHRRAARLLHGVAPALEPGRYVAATFELSSDTALQLFRGGSGLCMLCEKETGDRNAHVLVHVRHMNDWMRFRSPSVDGREGAMALKVIWSANGVSSEVMPYLPVKEDVVYFCGPSYTAGTHLLGEPALTKLVGMPNGRTHLVVSVNRRAGSSFEPSKGSEEALLRDLASLIESCDNEDAVFVGIIMEATNTAEAYDTHLETAARLHGDALVARGWGSLAEDVRRRLAGLFDLDDGVMGNVRLVSEDGGSVGFPLSVLACKSRHWWERLNRGETEPEQGIWIPATTDVTRWAIEMDVFGSLTESSRDSWDGLTLSESDSLTASALASLATSSGMDALAADYLESYFLNNVRADTAERAVEVALSMGRSFTRTAEGADRSLEWPSGEVVEALVPYALHGAFLRPASTVGAVASVRSKWTGRLESAGEPAGDLSFGDLVLRAQAEIFGCDASREQAARMETPKIDEQVHRLPVAPGRPIETSAEYRAELEEMERQMDSFWEGREKPRLVQGIAPNR